MSLVNYEVLDSVGVITVENPPVNAMSQAVRSGILDGILSAQQDGSKAIVILCDGRTFIAGADIKEFGKPPLTPTLPELLVEIENSTIPVIAAIHGTALGGGFELSLACHYRCAIESAKVGLPEVKLGLFPGAGGTQRVPRLAGVEFALDMISNGYPISVQTALENNLIDRVFDGELKESALQYAQELINSNAPSKRVRDIVIDPNTVSFEIFDQARIRFERRARGQPAPQHIVTCLENAVKLDFDQGLAKERELFLECMYSDESTAMRHLFFAEREAAKVEGIAKDTPRRIINSVGIIGGGTMGTGIAMCFASAGIQTTLLEVDEAALDQALEKIKSSYSGSVTRGKLSKQQRDKAVSLISGTTEYETLSDTELVIEAVFEDLELKRSVFEKLDEICKPGAILATNTSYQDIDVIADATNRPEDVIGMHFFSPAHIMKLLEVVRGSKSSDDVIATAMVLGKTIGKIPVLAGNCYGFIGNRMLRMIFRETQLCLIEGASPEQIDNVMEDFGMAMGPCAVGDLAGLDVGYKARRMLSEEEKGEPRTYCIADTLVEMGRLGQKTGAGYYLYDKETRKRISDPEVMKVIEHKSSEQGIERCQIDDDEIRDRILLSLINEGAHLLDEGIAQRASDIDVVYANGYGFPRFRGGPMHYASTLGSETVQNRIEEFGKRFGTSYWCPANGLELL